MSSPINTAISLTELDVCTPYWFVVRAATCGDAASSAPVKVDLDDTKLFELSFKLEDADRCTSFKQSESKQTVSKIEDLMNITLLSTDCGAFAVSCFAGSVLTCDGSDASLVYFRYTCTHYQVSLRVNSARILRILASPFLCSGFII